MIMEKINVAELLRDCPKGMELDCTMFEGVEFDGIVDNEYLPIRCRIKNPNGGYNVYNFTKHGYWNDNCNSKCVIFPKGKTSWEGFVPPCKFKDGDVVVSSLGNIHILKNSSTSYIYVNFAHNANGSLCKVLTICVNATRFATEEEKEKLFQTIKDNGYKWNPETKTLEKLVEPKFKVGDRIKSKENHNYIYTITGIREKENKYECGVTFVLRFSEQDNWVLVPDKFDITSLVPFESRVLVRGDKSSYWEPAIFGCYLKNMIMPYYALGGTCWQQCIPYENNEHLLGATDDCDEYFKTWK